MDHEASDPRVDEGRAGVAPDGLITVTVKEDSIVDAFVEYFDANSLFEISEQEVLCRKLALVQHRLRAHKLLSCVPNLHSHRLQFCPESRFYLLPFCKQS